MSKCTIVMGQKLKHTYPANANRCSRCGHITKHGKRFRLVLKGIVTPRKKKEAK